MLWRIDIATRPGHPNAAAASARAALRDAGAPIESVDAVQVILIEGDFDEAGAKRIAEELIADHVVETAAVRRASAPPAAKGRVITVFKKPGVTDPVEASAKKTIRDLGLTASAVRCGVRYEVEIHTVDDDPLPAAAKALGNEAVDDIHLEDRPFQELHLGSPRAFEKIICKLAELEKLNQEMGLSLNPAEIDAIRAHFTTLRRDPTDAELETVAQTWSEHCKHKTFNAEVNFNGTVIPNLIKTTIFQATKTLAKPWCVSVFKDNAGIVEFDETHNVCFKVETHNHPSAIEPYGGANTGIGGVIRDVLGCGLGAKPVANTNVFCVGLPDAKEIPPGTIHPKRLLKSVVAGVRDYGNRMGIPTVNGAVLFDERYTGNPLVYAGTVGLLPKAMSFKAATKGDVVLVVGGRTGRDGIHGATFSSVELHDKSETVSSGAVQIGNAIVEKMVLDTILQARDKGLYTAITDCGAGGLSSAVGEMGEELGAEVELDRVPLKYDGLTYAEIWISEAQERMVLSVPPAKLDEILAIFKAEDVEATAIGTFTGSKRLVLRYKGSVVADLDMEFIHNGIPKFTRKATYAAPALSEPAIAAKAAHGDDLLKILSSLNVCSKEWIIRQYDHEVQGGSVVKPLTGIANDGPSDAAVLRPVLSSMKALAIGCGVNPRYGDIDPYWMAANAIDEALRNVVAVGADPERISILDNFSWGDPNNPETLGALVRASQACHDFAVGFGTPFISGKDSLNNEYRVGGRRIRIPHTLLISAMGIVPDARKAVTMDLKEQGNVLYILGETNDELGGSHFYLVNGQLGANVPRVDAAKGKRIFAVLHALIQKGLVRACHDLSEGGLAVAAAEMAFAGGLGMKLDLELPGKATGVAAPLFSESASRFLIEVREKDIHTLDTLLVGIANAAIGSVTNDGRVVIRARGRAVIDEPISKLKQAWQAPLKW